ncbi:hypothetical protein RB653_004574 [Dictyostelium firmibasis]|uniref:mRNA cap guanine-N(7) methyltransferase n=1 Tax=Dictyostelium firmibasis TaxID=79012 RepID=A0AAN7TZS6_9MYCE
MSEPSDNNNESNINTILFKNVEIPNLEQFKNLQQQQQPYQQQQKHYRPPYQQQHQKYNPYGNRDTSYNPYRKEEGRDSLRQQQQLHFIKKQNELVSSHYDNKQNTPIHIRAQSKIISLKNINNWVKSMLIQEYTKPNTKVFDICGGKLGDLQKWIKAQIKSLIVSDISLESLKHGLERYNQNLNYIPFDMTMIAVDCFSSKLLDVFPKQPKKLGNKPKKTNQEDLSESEEEEEEDDDDDDDDENDELLKVDLVSCQFALHYSFRTEESARSLLKNVSSVLEDGGHFIGTIPNSCLIVKKLRESKSNKFGNEVFKIEFKEKEPKFSAFGCAYNFFLEDAIDFLEEYLVHIDVLTELARDYRLELVSHSNFHDLIYEKSKSKSSHDLLRKMNCFNSNNTISQAEWEALGIYKTFVFKKIGENNNSNNIKVDQVNKDHKAKSLSNEDIIVNL